MLNDPSTGRQPLLRADDSSDCVKPLWHYYFRLPLFDVIIHGMTTKLSFLADSQFGVFLRSQAITAGYSPREIQRRLGAAEWVGVRRGAYAIASTWRGMTTTERHRAMCFAVATKIGADAAISHTSAVAMHGLPMWGYDLSEVHVSKANVSRHSGGVFHHRTAVPPDRIVEIGGIPVTAAPRALVEAALISPPEPCVVTMDAALRDGITTKQELVETIDAMRDWPGARNAGRVVSLADGKSESLGESRARYAFYLADLPEPRLQYEIHDRRGLLVARVDFLFEEYRTIAEFDGKVKYTGELTPGTNPTDVLWREKKREDRLRAMGFEIVRITWADLTDVSALGAKVRAAFARARGGERVRMATR